MRAGNAKGSISIKLVDGDKEKEQNQQNSEDTTPTHKGRRRHTHTRTDTKNKRKQHTKELQNLGYYNEEEQKDKRKGGELSRACLAEGKTRAQATLPLEGR